MHLCSQCSNPVEDAHRFCATCGATLPEGPPSLRADPMIGRTLPGGYRVQHLAGIGGMGRVYLAEQTALGRTVAVKVIHPHLVGDENTAGRFIIEARAASRLNHPNSIAIFDFGTTSDGQLYLVMEYLRGKDLARVASEEGPLPFRRIADILRQTLAALDEAHELNIIHRDLKPENIILEPLRSGRDFVKVVDYGLAKMRDTSRAPLTSPGFVCGTPEYMSPEQGRGDALDPRADLYSVGVILYQLLTGRLPFGGETSTRVLLAHLTDAAPDPRLVAPERRIPEALADITLRALEKDPRDRFGSAPELAAALAEAFAVCESFESKPTQSVVRCGDCGALNAISQKYCGDCGTVLATAATPRATPPMPTRSSAGEAALRDSAAPTDAAPATSMPARTGELPLLAREETLAWLEARRDEAMLMPQTARIIGAAGMGKTRVLREFLASCTERGDVILETRTDPSAAEISGYALRDAVARLAGGSPAEWHPEDPEERRGLTSLFAPATIPPADGAERPAAVEQRARHARVLKWAVERASARSGAAPVILAVDDLDELDGVSKAAFVDVMTEPPLVPLMVVVTYADASARALEALGVVFPGEEHNLPKIAEHEAATLLPAHTMFLAHEIAPLHLEQLVRWTRETSDVPPAVLADLVAARIERLPTHARRVLQAFAVLGHESDEASVVALLAGTGTEATECALGEAALARGGFLKGRRVAHPLVRKIALAATPAAVRRELHAAALELRKGAPVEVRAHHAVESEQAFQALLLLEQLSAASAARADAQGSVHALRGAVELCRRELFRGELDDPLRALILFSRKLADALIDTSAFADAEGVLREALDMAAPNDADRAHLLAKLAQVAHARAHAKDAQDYLKQALVLARKSDARELVTKLETLERAIA